MGRPRKPASILEKNGAFKKNPNRRRVDLPSNGEIGDPPDHLTAAEQAIWHEIIGNAHDGTLCRSDRLFVEVLSRSIANLRNASEVRPTMVAEIKAMLAKLGMSPSDRAKVSPIQPPKAENPFSKI